MTRCKHGTYVGTPGGIDFMCQWCESDTEPPTIPVQILRFTAEGEWEPLFRPTYCYDYAHVGHLVDGFEELAGNGRLYALAVG